MRMNETVLGVVIMIIQRGLKLKNQFIASMSLWEWDFFVRWYGVGKEEHKGKDGPNESISYMQKNIYAYVLTHIWLGSHVPMHWIHQNYETCLLLVTYHNLNEFSVQNQ